MTQPRSAPTVKTLLLKTKKNEKEETGFSTNLSHSEANTCLKLSQQAAALSGCVVPQRLLVKDHARVGLQMHLGLDRPDGCRDAPGDASRRNGLQVWVPPDHPELPRVLGAEDRRLVASARLC